MMNKHWIVSALIGLTILALPQKSVAADVRAPSDVSAATMIEVSDRNQMLTAKNDMWFKGDTKAMDIHSDGSYINVNRRGSIPIR